MAHAEDWPLPIVGVLNQNPELLAMMVKRLQHLYNYLVIIANHNYGDNDKVNHVRWVPCHHGMARPQAVDGGDALKV
jgi:hypothetical protein